MNKRKILHVCQLDIVPRLVLSSCVKCKFIGNTLNVGMTKALCFSIIKSSGYWHEYDMTLKVLSKTYTEMIFEFLNWNSISINIIRKNFIAIKCISILLELAFMVLRKFLQLGYIIELFELLKDLKLCIYIYLVL